MGRTASAVRPSVLGLGNFFGRKLFNIAEVDADLLRCGFFVLFGSLLKSKIFYVFSFAFALDLALGNQLAECTFDRAYAKRRT